LNRRSSSNNARIADNDAIVVSTTGSHSPESRPPNYPRLGDGRRSLPAELDLLVRAMNASRNHVLILDMLVPGRPIVFANQALATRHGKTVEKLIGMELNVFRGNAPHSDVIDAAMDKGEQFRTEVHSQRPDGSPFSMELTLNPIRDASGTVTHYLSIGSDITALIEKKRELQTYLDTETKQRQHLEMELRLAQKLEAIGRLASGIAHEINTPIQYVGDSVSFASSSMAELLDLLKSYRDALQRIGAGAAMQEILADVAKAEAAADLEFMLDELPRAFDRTKDGVMRVATLVRAMKEFAHPQNNEQTPADINRALTTTLTVAGNEYKYYAVVVTDFGELPDVVCNINELNQVFLNLIVNSVHAIQDAGRDETTGRIDIRTSHVGNYVELVFVDNGCGIGAEHIDKIYDPFFTTKEVGRGTGQGLALTRAIIVEKHGGEIDVKSTPGMGTEFRLRLPIVGRQHAQAA
jgi:PAS domain S-box-containing protein